MAKILLYNIRDSEKALCIRLEAARMGAAVRTVEPGELTHPIGYLLGLPGCLPGLPGTAAAFDDEMLLLEGLRGSELNRFLDALRSRGAAVPLKAVVTEHNLNWSSLRLHRELKKEHMRLSAGKKSVHK